MRGDIYFLERIKRLVIVAMFADDVLMEHLVLKGGNLLDVVYEVSTRASVDVDFSIDGEFHSEDELRYRIERTLSRTFGEDELVPFDVSLRVVPPNLSDDLKMFWGGYKIDFKIASQSDFDAFRHDIEQLRRHAFSVGKRGSTRFRIDISKHEYCTGKQSQIVDGFTVYSYSPAMLVGEKLRAICQQMPEYVATVRSHPRARARDFLDIHTVTEHFSVDFAAPEFQALVSKIFWVKRVPLESIGKISSFREYHRPDFEAVKETVKPGIPLKVFDYYFDFVVSRCQLLKSLWHE